MLVVSWSFSRTAVAFWLRFARWCSVRCIPVVVAGLGLPVGLVGLVLFRSFCGVPVAFWLCPGVTWLVEFRWCPCCGLVVSRWLSGCSGLAVVFLVVSQ